MPLNTEIGPVKVYSPAAKGRPWRVTWCPPGLKRKVKERKTKAEAIELAKEIKSQLKRGEIGKVHRVSKDEAELLNLCRQLDDPKRALTEAIERQTIFKRVSLAECCQRYISEYLDRKSAMTRRDAETKAGVIQNTLGEFYIDTLSEGEIENWLKTKLSGSNRYRNNVLAHLRHLFERARVWGYVPKGHNPARDVKSLKVPRKEPEIWDPKDLRKCLNWYWNSDIYDAGSRVVFLALGAFAGMRPSEIEGVVGERDGLDWKDIDFKHRHIRVRPEVAGKLAEARYITFTEKSASGLTKEIVDSMWAALSAWILPFREKSGPVTLRKCQRIISPELRDEGLISDWPKDGLRHTWISSLLALGAHRGWVAELAGNSPAVIRTNYKHPLPEKAAKKWFCVVPS